METITYTYDHTERLDKFLVNDVGGFSRSQWQKVVKDGFVLVNDERVVAKHKLENGDVVTIVQVPTLHHVALPDMDIEIISETPDYIVVNKPSGIPVHPDNTYREGTLIQQVTKRFPDIAAIDPDSERSGIVHRLDKDVSGVMVIARTAEVFEHLKAQFHDRKVYKEYRALIHGTFQKKSDEIELNIDRDKKTGKMLMRPKNQEGKQTITQYEVLEEFEHFSLLKVVIKTGRTHQIRVVMRTLDHPIVGDMIYEKKKVKANLALERPFLHAYTLQFADLVGETQTFTAPLPGDLQSIIDSLS